MEFNRQDVDEIIKRFNRAPSKDDYMIINNWYIQNTNVYPDSEYMLCVYLFLLGANIKNGYIPFNKSEYLDWVNFIRYNIENAETIYKVNRKVYLDYGTKAGYYK